MRAFSDTIRMMRRYLQSITVALVLLFISQGAASETLFRNDKYWNAHSVVIPTLGSRTTYSLKTNSQITGYGENSKISSKGSFRKTALTFCKQQVGPTLSSNKKLSATVIQDSKHHVKCRLTIKNIYTVSEVLLDLKPDRGGQLISVAVSSVEVPLSIYKKSNPFILQRFKEVK